MTRDMNLLFSRNPANLRRIRQTKGTIVLGMRDRGESKDPASVSPADDAELLRKARKGDTGAFHQLVDRHADSLYVLSLSLTGNASDAEDVVQETLLGAYSSLASFAGRSSVKTWLSRILVNQAARHHRSQRVRNAAQPVRLSEASRAMLREASEHQSPIVASEIRMDVMEVLQSLRPEHRAVIALRELDGLSYAEVAEVLNLPQGTVESRLHHAREELKLLLMEYME